MRLSSEPLFRSVQVTLTCTAVFAQVRMNIKIWAASRQSVWTRADCADDENYITQTVSEPEQNADTGNILSALLCQYG